MIVFGMVCKKDLKKQQRRKSVYKIGYDHSSKTERLIINNIIVVVLLFSSLLLLYCCIASGLACAAVGLLCGWLVCCAISWIMGDLNKPLLFRVDARKRGKGRAQEKHPGHTSAL
jgi:hypothetical protein